MLRTALGALLLGAGACGPAGSAGEPARPSDSAPPEVRVALVREESWERSIPAQGELAPWERVVLATKVPGRLALLRVDRGDRVARGEVLAELEARDYELRAEAAGAALASARALLGLDPGGEDDALDPESTSGVRLARAELERARLERERAATLAGVGVDSQAVLDEADASLRAAESRLQEALELVDVRRANLMQRRAELEIARAQLDETRIEAPFDGRVQLRLSATGAYLSVGSAVLELVRVDPLRLVLEVSEREAAAVRPGQSVRARVQGREVERLGTIARLAPALRPESRTRVVEVEIPDPAAELLPGSFVEARIIVAPEESALSIPAEALVSFAGLDKAWVVRAGVAEERRLVVGRRDDARLEVLSGLEAGEEVVLSPGRLKGGQAVRVVH